MLRRRSSPPGATAPGTTSAWHPEERPITHDLTLAPLLRAAVTCAVVAVAIPAAAAPAIAGERTPCRPSGATTTLASSADMRVYKREHRYTTDVYACWRRTGRTTRLGPQFEAFADAAIVHRFRIAGRYLGFARERSGRQGLLAQGRVVDVATGRTVRATELGGLGDDATEAARLSDLVVTRRGTAAFIFTVGGRDVTQQLRVTDGATPTAARVVDEGPDLGRASLELADQRTLRWLHGGVARNAPIR